MMSPPTSTMQEPPPKTVPRPLSPTWLHAATKTVLSYALAGRILFHVSLLRSAARPEAWGIRMRSAPLQASVPEISGKCDSKHSWMPTTALEVLKTGRQPPASAHGFSRIPRCVFL